MFVNEPSKRPRRSGTIRVSRDASAAGYRSVPGALRPAAQLVMMIALIPLPAGMLPAQPAATEPSPGDRIAREIRAENCEVHYIDKVAIPARAEGPLLELSFREGDTVTEDDVLAVIDDTQAQLTKELHEAKEKEAMLNAANDVNIRNARNSARLAEAEFKSFQDLRKQGAIPYWEMKKKEFEADRAVLAIELAEMNMKIAEVQMIAARSEREIAEFDLTLRKVVAPLTGHIEERIAQTGQWVRPGDPVALLIQMDRLRVKGVIDALNYPGVVRKGAAVTVKIDTQANKAVEFDGKLGFVSLELDSRGRYRVWVEFENKRVGDDWLFKPGMKADVTIIPKDEVF